MLGRDGLAKSVIHLFRDFGPEELLAALRTNTSGHVSEDEVFSLQPRFHHSNNIQDIYVSSFSSAQRGLPIRRLRYVNSNDYSPVLLAATNHMEPPSLGYSSNQTAASSRILNVILKDRSAYNTVLNFIDINVFFLPLYFGMFTDHIATLLDMRENPLKKAFLHTP
jgi:hypothetical protein